MNRQVAITQQVAITKVNEYIGTGVLGDHNTHFSNIIKSRSNTKEVWWLNIPQAKFNQDLHLLLIDKVGGFIIWLKLPAKTFESLNTVFKIRNNGKVDLEISSLRDSYMIDIKSGGTKYNFAQHIEHKLSYDA